jgi:hypothetical protein
MCNNSSSSRLKDCGVNNPPLFFCHCVCAVFFFLRENTKRGKGRLRVVFPAYPASHTQDEHTLRHRAAHPRGTSTPSNNTGTSQGRGTTDALPRMETDRHTGAVQRGASRPEARVRALSPYLLPLLPPLPNPPHVTALDTRQATHHTPHTTHHTLHTTHYTPHTAPTYVRPPYHPNPQSQARSPIGGYLGSPSPRDGRNQSATYAASCPRPCRPRETGQTAAAA